MGKLTTRQLKAKEVLDYAMSGTKYKDIADKIGSKAKPENKRQTIYNKLQGKSVQAEMAKVAEALDYSVTDCIKELQRAFKIAEKKDQSMAMTSAAMAKAKVKGLLVDKVQDITTPDLDQTAKSAQVMLDELDKLEKLSQGQPKDKPN